MSESMNYHFTQEKIFQLQTSHQKLKYKYEPSHQFSDLQVTAMLVKGIEGETKPSTLNTLST